MKRIHYSLIELSVIVCDLTRRSSTHAEPAIDLLRAIEYLFEMPIRRTISATGVPVSARLIPQAICSSLCLDFFPTCSFLKMITTLALQLYIWEHVVALRHGLMGASPA